MDSGSRGAPGTDIVGSTEMTLRLGDMAALELVRVHDDLVRRGLALHAGREVKHTGDGIMAAFDEVANLFAPPPTFSGASTITVAKRAKACGFVSAFTPANRSRNTIISSAPLFRWRSAYAAKPKPAEFSCPD